MGEMPSRRAPINLSLVLDRSTDAGRAKLLDLARSADAIVVGEIFGRLNVQAALLVLDEQCHVLAANRAFYLKFGLDADAVRGASLYALGEGEWDLPALRTLLETILPRESTFERFEIDHVFASAGRERPIPARPAFATTWDRPGVPGGESSSTWP